jgi:uncharacterized protein YndB with AHSA1/START domain
VNHGGVIEVRRYVAATPEQVFAVLSDGWLYPLWVVGASRIRGVDDTWPAVGSRIHHSFGVWPAVIDDTTHVRRVERDRSISLIARGWPLLGEAQVDITLVADGDGTQVTIAEDAVRGPGTLVPRPFRQVAIGPRNAETLRRLAYLAEGRA